MDWKQKLKDPPKEYRAIHFWPLNDELDADELRRQIQDMKKAGLGGFFMYARSWPKTRYMLEQWLRAMEICIDEGIKQDISPWLYNANGWPNWFVGNRTLEKETAYQQKWLECQQIDADHISWDDRTLGIFVLGESYRTVRVIADDIKGDVPKPEGTLVRIKWTSDPYCIDVLNKEAVEAFIEDIYEVYYDRFGDKFGSAIPGIFTDEPQYASGKIPWSFVLAAEFENEHGYSIISSLPALFFKVGDYQRVRYDFWRTVNYLFNIAFSQQISAWCRKHNIILSGHVMARDGMLSQMRSTAGAMPFYIFMQMPGIDWPLCLKDADPLAPKQVSSVARQMGCQRVISEMFDCSESDLSFEELKWIIEWQYVLGVNIMGQHLQQGNIRRHSPNFFCHRSWWNEDKVFNDYFARLSLLLTEGQSIVDVLLIHPLHSAWAEYSPIEWENVRKLDIELSDISRWLMEMHIDYDYGDEDILAKYGNVEGNDLTVGRARYKVVIIPPAVTLDRSTVRLLMRFAEAGGRIVSVGAFPLLINGRQDDGLSVLKQRVIRLEKNKESIAKVLAELPFQKINICRDDGSNIEHIYCQQRDMGKGQRVLFMLNINQKEGVHAVIKLSGHWSVSLCHLENGDISGVLSAYDSSCTSFTLTFLPMQSYAILLEKAK